MPKKSVFHNNRKWLDNVMSVIPGGCSTTAKAPDRVIPGVTPLCCGKAYGSHFIDIDGNVWIDCDMSMGSVIWGHCRQEINEAVARQLSKGSTFSLPGDIELEAAEKILRRVGFYNRIKFFKTGADAVTAAVRYGRAITKRKIVACGAYHGWHDWSVFGYYGVDCISLGIPREVAGLTSWIGHTAFESFKQKIDMVDDLACVVVCPGDWSTEDLASLRDFCTANRSVLIFDEISSGMREGKNGVIGTCGIKPEILCIGKGLANGMPLAATLFDDSLDKIVQQAMTGNVSSSECLSLAAASAGEDLMTHVSIWPSWVGKGNAIIEEIRKVICASDMSSKLVLKGNSGCFSITEPGFSIREDNFCRFLSGILAEHMIFSKGYIIFSDAHSDKEIKFVGEAVKESIYRWAEQCG